MHVRQKTRLSRKKNMGVVTRKASSALLGSRPKRTRTKSQRLLESLESEASTVRSTKKNENRSQLEVLGIDRSTSTNKRKSIQRSDIDVDNICCCLCNIPIDYTEKELFALENSQNDQKKLLPYELYDPQNNIIICDNRRCNRAYHQRCHFVPVLSVPKGEWFCILCQFKNQMVSQKINRHNEWQPSDLQAPISSIDLDKLFRASSDSLTIDDPLTRLRFEFQSSHLKAHLLNKELTSRFKASLDQQLMRIRRAKDNIRTYATLKSIRKSLIEDYIKYRNLPQELVQNVCLMARSKLKIRQLFCSLQKLVRNFDEEVVLKNTKTNDYMIVEDLPDFHLLMTKMNRRKEPRFDIKDYDADEDDGEEDEDPTEKIKCCVCFSGHVGEDENDVLMCDGRSCMRAFHMKCVVPHVTQKMLDDDIDGTWFCPFCTAFANFIHYARIEYLGDEAKDQRKTLTKKLDDDDMSDTTWDEADEIFSEASLELDAAQSWHSKCRNKQSDSYLSSILGVHFPENYTMEYSINEEDESIQSPQKNVLRMKSSARRVGSFNNRRSNEQENDEIVYIPGRLKSCRQVRTKEVKSFDNTNQDTINSSNIIQGKRLRTNVDYKRLNELLSAEDSDDH